MIPRNGPAGYGPAGTSNDLEDDIVELALLLPAWQAAALEATAHGQGLTSAQMVRRLIQEFFAKFAQPRPA
jgi:hypothetical protein